MKSCAEPLIGIINLTFPRCGTHAKLCDADIVVRDLPTSICAFSVEGEALILSLASFKFQRIVHIVPYTAIKLNSIIGFVVEIAQKSRKLSSSSMAPKQVAIPALREKKLVFMPSMDGQRRRYTRNKPCFSCKPRIESNSPSHPSQSCLSVQQRSHLEQPILLYHLLKSILQSSPL